MDLLSCDGCGHANAGDARFCGQCGQPLSPRCAGCGAGYHDTFRPTEAAGVCDGCGGHEFKRRADDNEEAVRTRMAEYRAKTAPILPFYETRDLVRRVDGMGSVDQVTAAIDALLDSQG